MHIGLGLGLTRISGGGASFSPLSLFASSEAGAWYDPSDLSTLWKDTAGTDPVTTAGDTVARVDDKSGNGNNLTQATAAARPVYQTAGGLHWLEFDGVDDFLVSPTITPGVDTAQVFAGVTRDDAHTGIVVEHSASLDANNGALHLAIVTNTRQAASKGTIGRTATNVGAAAPQTELLTLTADIDGNALALRANGAEVDVNSFDQGTGNFLAYPLYVGRRAGTALPFDGNIYGLVLRFGANLDADTIAATETYLAEKTGVTL